MAKRIIIIFIVFVLLIIGGWQARRFFPYPAFFARLGIENWQVWEFHDYFEIDPSTLSVVLNDRRLVGLENPPVMTDGQIYFPYTFVREHIDPFVFWDNKAQILFVSTDTEIIRLPGQMIPISFVRDMYTFPYFEIKYEPMYNTVIIHNRANSGAPAATTRHTSIRYRPDHTAFITKRAENGTSLTAFNAAGEFTRIRTPEGLLGYVLSSDIVITGSGSEGIYLEPPTHPAPRINLAWEMITAPIGNATVMNNPLPRGLNVISPTWFNFDPYLLDGTIISFADRDYVEWAHAEGVKVWPKVFDTNQNISHAILTSYQARSRAINQLIQFVEHYNLDGININFEHIRSTDGYYYLQFLRELAVEMRRIDSVLSVATFVPAPWRERYKHNLVGKTVDFVAIMTYDEHYGGSPNPGPVASLPFVRQYIRETLELIPREKVLMGLPFYNRLWRVTPDGNHTIRNIGMAYAWRLVEEWGITPIWDEVIGSYYTNFITQTDEGIITYRMWIECERSIREKLRIFTYYDLAGVASWQRSLETPGVWEEIERVMP